MTLQDIAAHPKTGAAVSTASMSIGMLELMGVMQSVLGTLAALSGLLLSVILIIVHLRREKREVIESRLRVEALKRDARY